MSKLVLIDTVESCTRLLHSGDDQTFEEYGLKFNFRRVVGDGRNVKVHNGIRTI